MDPIAFSVINNDKTNASLRRDVSINKVSFLESIKELAKTRNLVVADGSKLNELDLKKNEEVNWTAGGWGEEDPEEKILGFLTRIKRILEKTKNNKEVK